MQASLTLVRNVDYQDRHFYLVEVKSKSMTVLTLGKFNEHSLEFEYFNYYTNSLEYVDIYESKKLLGVYSIENLINDLDYHRIFTQK